MATIANTKSVNAGSQATVAEQVLSIFRNNKLLTPANQLLIDEIQSYYRISKSQLTNVYREKEVAEENSLKLTSILEDKKLEVDTLKRKLDDLNDDRLVLRNDNDMLLKQRNIFCNIAKRLYEKLMKLNDSLVISKLLHKQMLPFLEYKLSEVDKVNYDCENIISSEFVPNMSYNYGIVNVEEHLSSKQLLEIVNNTLTTSEQKKIIEKSNIENENKLEDYADLDVTEDNSDSQSDIEEELEEVDCAFNLFNTKLTSDSSDINCKDTCKADFSDDDDNVEVSSILDSDDENEDEIIFAHTKLVLDESHYYVVEPIEIVETSIQKAETSINAHVYPNVLNVPNQVFVKQGCANEVPLALTKLVSEENSKITNKSFWSRNRIIENKINAKINFDPTIKKFFEMNDVNKTNFNSTAKSVWIEKGSKVQKPQILEKDNKESIAKNVFNKTVWLEKRD